MSQGPAPSPLQSTTLRSDCPVSSWGGGWSNPPPPHPVGVVCPREVISAQGPCGPLAWSFAADTVQVCREPRALAVFRSGSCAEL